MKKCNCKQIGMMEVIEEKLFPDWLENAISWVFPITLTISVSGSVERIWKSGWFSSSYKLKKDGR